MIVNADSLRRDTVALIRQIDKQIALAEEAAHRKGVSVNQLLDSDGNWVLNPLLLAKAVAYNTLVTLQTDVKK